MKKIMFFIVLNMCFMLILAQPIFFTLPPYKLNFSGASPSISNITGATTTQYKVSNGAYDENGNLLFYIKDGSVYTINSSLIGGAFIANNQVGHSHEISIVPVPGQCKKFYIIGFVNGLYTCQLYYSTIDCSTPTPTIVYNTIALLSDGGQKNGIAVSKLIGNTNTRFLYSVSFNYVKKWIISSSGITLSSTANRVLDGSNYETFSPSELELSSDVSKLIFSSSYSTQYIYEYKLDVNGDFNTISPPRDRFTLPTGVTNVHGVEIDASNSKVYLCTNNGLYYKTIGSSTFNQITGTSTTYSNSFIESAKDGYMYIISNSGVLGKINTYTSTVSVSGISQSLQSNASQPSLYGAPYTLPDNIDGDNYDYFFGVVPAVSGFAVNSTAVPASCSSPLALFNCNTITLNNTGTGAANYQVELWNSASSCGTYTSVYNSGYVSTFPNDLKNLPGMNGTWLQTHTGFFKVILTTKNSCGTVFAPQTGYINVASAPTGATASFKTYAITKAGQTLTLGACTVPANTQLAYLDGTTSCGGVGGYKLAMEHSSTVTPNEVGRNNTVFDLTGVSPGIGSSNYTVTIKTDKWSGTAWVNMNYSGVPENYTGITSTTLNGLLEDDPGNPYYEAFLNPSITPNGSIYKITITVINECGSYSSSQVIKLNTTTLKRIASPDITKETTVNKNCFSVYPNPTKEKLTIDYYLENEKIVNIQLFDYSGREVINATEENWTTAGNHSVEINISSLPNGIYFYRVDADKLCSGKIVKIQ